MENCLICSCVSLATGAAGPGFEAENCAVLLGIRAEGATRGCGTRFLVKERRSGQSTHVRIRSARTLPPPASG